MHNYLMINRKKLLMEYWQFYTPCVWAWGGKQMAVIKYGCTPFPALFGAKKQPASGVQATFGFVGHICSNIFDMKKQPAH
ncbi:hypothetical protein [Kingella denitrificans]